MRGLTAASDHPDSGFSRFRTDQLTSYDPAGEGVNVKEDDVRPLGRGPFQFAAEIANLGDISLVRVHIGGKSVGTTVTDPDHLAFVMPLSWTGDFLLNGEAANPASIYLSADTNSFHVLAGRRCVLGVCLPRTAFIETMAALRGVEPEDLAASDRLLTHAPAVATELRRRLTSILDATVDQTPHPRTQDMADDVFALMADAYLAARPAATSTGWRSSRSNRIVRKAEQYFMAAEGRKISLADLCVAAGVGKSTLYHAFQRVCGQPPLQYFHGRRLSKARLALHRSFPQRGAVKRVALDNGFTELGRFAGEYRLLFGESPSATLNSGQRGL